MSPFIGFQWWFNNYFALLLLLCATGCTLPEQPEVDPTATVARHNTTARHDLKIGLALRRDSIAVGEPIWVEWSIYNPNEDTVIFYGIQTPFLVPKGGNFFALVDQLERPIPYLGAPPFIPKTPSENHQITLPPQALLQYWVDLMPLYQLRQAGRYTVRFIGTPQNRLPNSPPASFVLY